MGGRGTFAAGNAVPYTYKTVGFIDGVKVLQGSPGYKGLPVESHSSCVYIQFHPDGTFHMLREFDKDHYLVREIAYHPEPKLTGHHRPALHVHEYQRDNFSDRQSRLLTDTEKKRYAHLFKGVIE